MFYAGEEDFLAGASSFLRAGLTAGEPMLVAVSALRIGALQDELGAGADSIAFVDMAALGRNPARIIPAWRDFIAKRFDDRPVRGIGEPIWAGRSDAELEECHHHESLLNLAFADTSSFRLLCPYDTEGLPDDVLEEARRTHPFVAEDDVTSSSPDYVDPVRRPGPFSGTLPNPTGPLVEATFVAADIGAVRRLVLREAQRFGLDSLRARDLMLAVSELATNSVLHGGGGGVVRLWRANGTLLCEVHDEGRFEGPLVGRERPTNDQASGRGLWVVNHLCDLVQIRSSSAGSAVRLHMNIEETSHA
jgi:anti-sigma regulatory factor (Ser/Thr protein kinase)